MYCGGDVSSYNVGDIVNPFINGITGIWRLKKTYEYNTDRTPNTTLTSTETRKDGVYSQYTPFWEYYQTDDIYVPIYNSNHSGWSGSGTYENWVVANEITKYDPYRGSPVEAKDIQEW